VTKELENLNESYCRYLNVYHRKRILNYILKRTPKYVIIQYLV